MRVQDAAYKAASCLLSTMDLLLFSTGRQAFNQATPSTLRNLPVSTSRTTSCSIVTASKSIVPYRCGKTGASAAPSFQPSGGAVSPTGAAASYRTSEVSFPGSMRRQIQSHGSFDM
ncbi:hypothetical protein COCSUDRAFT_32066 [Coccomyxa subellipsoidea C-169]|uniref:Uncharacterized protein n=1 Tax=Coccomyxa subellipsoidea (strain C-169) TaxID=574566 RepID=I0ZAH3_COCSC|nr:hypothetical protein COCSUDRAFT_32066 [Coccomyxa subellipsoidea C-169]EIE27642.1 hypothetical protein COCSUDRAFT_32066 [Coccomyxa subellipsoidea C-169]|eukprot:XP_005652186.1 hypothetical protein COCSUDRAFT_32066 [Coccomyxa subellipsoidea C-169]